MSVVYIQLIEKGETKVDIKLTMTGQLTSQHHLKPIKEEEN